MDDRKQVNEMALKCLYEKLFCVWPLLRRKLQPTPEMQAEIGMPFSYVQILFLLEQNACVSITEISARFGIAKPNITPMIDRLIEDGLVSRGRAENDRRVVTVALLDKGRERINQISRVFYNHLRVFFSTLKADDLAELDGALEVIIRLLQA